MWVGVCATALFVAGCVGSIEAPPDRGEGIGRPDSGDGWALVDGLGEWDVVGKDGPADRKGAGKDKPYQPGDRKIIMKVLPQSQCGCGPLEPPVGKCGWFLGAKQVIEVEAIVVPPVYAPETDIGKMALFFVDKETGDEYPMDIQFYPVPGTDIFELEFDVASTPGGLPGFKGQPQEITLKFAAAAKYVEGDPGLLNASEYVDAYVDVDGPNLEVLAPAPDGSEGPFMDYVPYELVAGDGASGLRMVQLVIKWQPIATIEEILSPWTNEHYDGKAYVAPLGTTSTTLKVAASDCAGNWTTKGIPVDLVGKPDYSEAIELAWNWLTSR